MLEAINNFENQVPHWVWNGAIILASLVVGLIIKTILLHIFSRYAKKTDLFLFKSISKYIQRPANFLIPLVILNMTLSAMHMDVQSPVHKTVEVALLLAFSFLLIRIVKVVEELIKHRNDVSKTDNLKERKIRTQIKFISQMAVVIIVVLTIAAILLSFESMRKIGAGLLAGVGVGGIIIGFAAQSTLSNILAGFQIALTQPIRIDDVVVVEGEWGRIEDITLTYVVLKIWDERRLVLPINYFLQKPFQNWTRVNSDILGTVFLYLDYTVPIDKIRTKFKSLLEESPLWDRKVQVIQVTDSKESTVEVRALMSAKNSGEAFDLRCHVREQLIAYIQSNFPESLPKTRNEVLLEKRSPEKEITQKI